MLRTTSAQIDLRGQGIEAVKRMGLIDAVGRRLVDEAGVSLIDTKGNVEATILVGADGQGLHIRRNSPPPGAPDAYHQLGVYVAY